MESELMNATSAESASSMLPPATGSTNINVGTSERIGSVFLGAAAATYGLRNLGSMTGLSLALTGGFLLYRGLTGYCAVNNAFGRNSVSRRSPAMETTQTVHINKPRSEVYAFWRRLENLPMFMKHLAEVKVEDSIRSTWKAEVPGGLGTVTWESVITEDRPGELLSWASLPGSTIDNAGEVRFLDDMTGFGTEIQVNMTYRLPAGDLGTLAGKLFSPAVKTMIQEDIQRFKSIMETGETPSTTSETSSTSLSGSSYAETSEPKTRKGRQSRKKPDASIGGRIEPGSRADSGLEVDQSDLLERNDRDF